MANQFSCWKCHQALVEVILPMSRREECANCGADQHVCEMCSFFIKGHCDEDRAEQVNDTERANFCDYFKPSTHAQPQQNSCKTSSAKAQLAAFFGDPEPVEDDPQDITLTPAELAVVVELAGHFNKG
jgi:hypothetical protein